MPTLTPTEIGREVERRMEANGGDRKKAVRALVREIASDDTKCRDLVRDAGEHLVSHCFRRYAARHRGEQPDQLKRDSSSLKEALDRNFPTGRDGRWKRAGDHTREDVAEQVATWKQTVRGLQPRIDAGETLLETMDGGETLADILQRDGERIEVVATYLGVEVPEAAAA